ncbi:MAG: hypothetical protein ACLFOY_09590 [Desulfatibacillaceae bacterium]
MSKRKYRLQAKCPQCGCSFVNHLSPEEIEKRYGGLDNVHLECGECMEKFEANMKEACPEYAEDCKK